MESKLGGNNTEANGILTNAEIASQVISKYAGTASTTGSKRKINALNKDDEEYSKKRARNNVAVKKSREKAKYRIVETQNRVEQLSNENEELQTKVTLLSKELNVLRALFTNGGFTLPSDLSFASNSHGDHLPHSPDSLSSHSGSLYENSTPHSIAHSHGSHKGSNISKLDETKIPPLRPMPRIVSTAGPTSSKGIISSSYASSKLYSDNNRDSILNFPKSSTFPKKDIRLASPPLSTSSMNSVPGHNSAYNSYSSIPYKKYYETQQHTSVIRNAPKVSEQSSSPSLNTLGKFCIISDPENNGQIKILPINS